MPTPYFFEKAITYLGYLQGFTKVVAYYARKHEKSNFQFLIMI
jgi:hypothetical protein